MIKDLSNKLKTLRMSQNLSQSNVAKKLEISPSIVSGYETDERTPSTENLLALSSIYKRTAITMRSSQSVLLIVIQTFYSTGSAGINTLLCAGCSGAAASASFIASSQKVCCELINAFPRLSIFS